MMGLPKNFQKQNTQITKRVDSLNDLNFYTVEYTVRLTKNFIETNPSDYDWGTELEEFGKPISINDHYSRINTKKFSALNEEQANSKISEWLDKQVENRIISEWDIKSMDTNTFYDVLNEKGLLPLLDIKTDK